MVEKRRKEAITKRFAFQGNSISSHIFHCYKFEKIYNAILITEHKTMVHSQWDTLASNDVLKHHMITTDAIIIKVLKAMKNPLIC